MICEAVINEVLQAVGGTDKLLLHFNNISLDPCIVSNEIKKAFLTFGLLYVKVLVFSHVCCYHRVF